MLPKKVSFRCPTCKGKGTVLAVRLRKVSHQRAKREIIEYLKFLKKRKVKQIYSSDVAERLGLDILLVTTIFQELEKENCISMVKD